MRIEIRVIKITRETIMTTIKVIEEIKRFRTIRELNRKNKGKIIIK